MSNKFQVEKVDTKDAIVNYAYDFITDSSDSIFITEYETALILAEEIEGLDDEIDVLDRTYCDIEEDEIVYIKNLGDGIFVINNVFTEDGDIRIIDGSFILIEQGLLLDDVIDDFIIAEEELEIIGIEDDIEPCICCERCHGCDDIQLPYDLLDEAQQEFIDEIVNETEYSADVLSEVFIKGYQDGANSSMLNLGQQLIELAEED